METTLENNNLLIDIIIRLLQHSTLSADDIGFLYHTIAVLLIAVLAKISHMATKSLLNTMITGSTDKWNEWNELLQTNRFFVNLSHTVPAVVITPLTAEFIQHQTLSMMLNSGTSIYLVVAVAGAIFSVLTSTKQAYSQTDLMPSVPIDGLVQACKFIIVLIALLLIVSVILNKSPVLLLSGLGAMTAVIILVFRDTILGLMAGINILVTRTINNGDWVSIPKYQADGKVLEMSLTTVTIQNWDKTISTIPTSALMTSSLKNWRGMEQSEGRRIKRAILIDAQSLKIASAELKNILTSTGLDITPPFEKTTAPAQTNLGLLRNYMHHTLCAHPMINQDLTLLVRQLAPTATGIPVEIICFSRDKRWANYESLQAELIEHFLASLPLFELRSFQHISDIGEGA